MAENYKEDLFKPAKKGGYDREDVEHRFQVIKEAASIEKNQLQDQIHVKEQEILGLNEQIRDQQNEIDSLKTEISEKYQSYKDNYDMIGQLIFDSKVQAKKIVEEANAERDQILGGANAEVEKMIAETRSGMLDDLIKEKEDLEYKILEKKVQYDEICKRIAALVGKMDGVCAMVDDSVKTMHEIADGEFISLAIPEEESLDEPDEDLDEPDEEPDEAAQEAAEETACCETDDREIPDENPDDAFDVADTHEIEFERLQEDDD